MAQDGLSGRGMLFRFLGAAALVHFTYNPEGYSLFHWTFQPLSGGISAFLASLSPLKALAALVLAAGWVVFLQATKRSLSLGGTLLVVGIFGVLVWALIYYGVFSATSSKVIAHIVLLLVSLVLAVGMSWSHLSRKLTGQMDTDQVA